MQKIGEQGRAILTQVNTNMFCAFFEIDMVFQIWP